MSTSNVKADINQYIEFYSIVNDVISNDTVQQMKNFRQHYDTSTFEHCFNVAFISYKICKKLNLDYISMARAGMLHDLYLYDWRDSKAQQHLDRYHAFIHPEIALKNAEKEFELNDKEKDIILKHMWPLTLKLPKYPESYIITLVDKYSTLMESFKHYHSILTKKKPN